MIPKKILFESVAGRASKISNITGQQPARPAGGLLFRDTLHLLCGF